MKSVDILMATCNGEDFIAEQIESIVEQTFRDWHLIIRDDRSADRTPDIINAYKHKFTEKITVIEDDKKGLGASLNFGELLTHSDAEYVMFADQDDHWLPHKIEVTLRKMRESERIYGKDRALLVFTDLVVADVNLNTVCPSFWKYRNINPGNTAINCLLTENVVTGCTVMINRHMRDIASPVPPGAILHDWWIALLASAFGKIEYIADTTVIYRQHAKNDVGARKRDAAEALRYLLNIQRLVSRIRSYRHFKAATILQASSFYKKYVQLSGESTFRCDSDIERLVRSYIDFDMMNFFNRKLFLLRNRLLNGYYMTRVAKFLVF